MTPARKFKVLTRLSKLAFDGSGITAEQAVQRADERLETIRPPCLATLDETLAEIDTTVGRQIPNRAEQPIGDLYERCRRVITLALFAPGCELDMAARALCHLLDFCGETGVWEWDAVDVHLDSMRLLRTQGAVMTVAERKAVLGGLARVTEKRFAKAKG